MEAGADDYLVKPIQLDDLQLRLTGAERVIHLHRTLESANQELRNVARRDPLTGLGNRRCLSEDLLAVADRTDRYGHRFSSGLPDTPSPIPALLLILGRLVANDHDGAGGMARAMLARRAQQQAGEAAVAATADHQQYRFLGGLHQGEGRRTLGGLGVNNHTGRVSQRLRHRLAERGLRIVKGAVVIGKRQRRSHRNGPLPHR